MPPPSLALGIDRARYQLDARRSDLGRGPQRDQSWGEGRDMRGPHRQGPASIRRARPWNADADNATVTNLHPNDQP